MTINTVASEAKLAFSNDKNRLSEKAKELENGLVQYKEKDFSSVKAFYESELYSNNSCNNLSHVNRCSEISTFFQGIMALCSTYTQVKGVLEDNDTALKDIIQLFDKHDKVYAKYEKLAWAVDNAMSGNDIIVSEKNQLTPTEAYQKNQAFKRAAAQKYAEGIININREEQPTPTKVQPIEQITIAPVVSPVKTPAITVHFKQQNNGDELYIRGTGPGMSWNKGIKLTTTSDGTHTLTLPNQYDAFEFKILLNDNNNQWSEGANYQVAANGTLVATPKFTG